MLLHVEITPADATASRPRALVVDDDPLTRAVHARLLNRCGLDAATAANGLEAVHAVRGAQAIREPFELILMDVAMPVVDGWVASSTVRRDGYAGRLVVVSATADRDTPARCACCGVDYFLLKPAPANVLMATIKACVNIPYPRHRNPRFGRAAAPARQACRT